MWKEDQHQALIRYSLPHIIVIYKNGHSISFNNLLSRGLQVIEKYPKIVDIYQNNHVNYM